MPKKPRYVIEYRVYNLPLDVPALVLTGDHWYISDEISGRFHFHNCTEVGLCHSGEGVIMFEGEKLVFRAGDVIIIPRHVPHTTYSRKGSKSLWSYIFIDFEELLREEPCSGESARHYHFNAETHAKVCFFASCLFEELRDKKTDWVHGAKAVSEALLIEVARLSEGDGKVKDSPAKSFILKPALEYLRENYTNTVRIKDLADICHLSETHFRRMFISIMGVSPLSFVNDMRIKHACVLLDTTEMSVFEVSNAVGISSFSNFDRNFKSLTGLCPREYRRVASKEDVSLKRKQVLRYQGWLNPEEHPEFVLQPEDVI